MRAASQRVYLNRSKNDCLFVLGPSEHNAIDIWAVKGVPHFRFLGQGVILDCRADAGVDISISTVNGGFNLLGNPYTSFINSKTLLEDGVNATNLTQQIWVWDQDDAGGNFSVKAAGEEFMVAPGQGFFVKATSGTNVNFAESNQHTNTDTFLKSSRTELKILLSDDSKTRYAKLYFFENATKGFDNGWEGEVFGGIANSTDIYTHLVNNSIGKKYQLQSLPRNDIENTIVPIGVKANVGKELTFRVESSNLPLGVKVFLEDRLNNTFNELSNTETYKIVLSETLNGIGRFYLHTSSSALSTEDVINNSKDYSIYTTKENNLRIVGVNGNATIKLFNLLGKSLLSKKFSSNGVSVITLPSVAKGVYLVQLNTAFGYVNKKIILK